MAQQRFFSALFVTGALVLATGHGALAQVQGAGQGSAPISMGAEAQYPPGMAPLNTQHSRTVITPGGANAPATVQSGPQAASPATAAQATRGPQLLNAPAANRSIVSPAAAGKPVTFADAPSLSNAAPTEAAGALVQNQALEVQVRNLTGTVERLQFKIRQLESRLDKLVGDVDYRLQALEQGGVPARAQPSAPQAAGPAPSAEAAAPVATAAPRSTGTLQQQLQGKVAAPGGPATAAPTQLQPNGQAKSPEDLYKDAITLVRKKDYAGAEKALAQFLAEHKDHKLANNASYWYGETFYVRGDFKRAAEVFLSGYQTAQDGPKAPDNLVKLGLSLKSLGHGAEACAAFGEVTSKFPKASPRILGLAKRELKADACQ